MAGHAKKATKKFEKNRLKDTLEKRKEIAKIKQRNQLKAKKKARNAKDSATSPSADPSLTKSKDRPDGQEKLIEMSVDQFFQGGFELPEPKKVKAAANVSAHAPKTGKRKCGSDDASSESSSKEDDQPSAMEMQI